MRLFNKNNQKGGFMDEIRCDEPSYLIWKWHPAGSQLGENNRENSIRWGSSLRVKEGEAAIFMCNNMGDMIYDIIEGPFDSILETANLPVLADFISRAYSGGTPFQAEVYFINLARIIQVKFGVPFFDVYDPRFTDFGVPVAVRGTISFQISDYREFIKLHRLNNFNLEDFQKQIRDAVSRYVKDAVTNAPAANNIPVVQIESKTAQINDAVEYDIGERLKEDFGVTVSGVDIGVIEIDKSSDAYAQLMAVTQHITAATVQAQAAANIKSIQNQQPGAVPPPIPATTYHVAVNGQAAGPFDLAALKQMVATGQLVAGSLVWKAGMTEWVKAETVDELKDVFASIPPVPPTE